MARPRSAKLAEVTWSQPASMAPGVPFNVALAGAVSASQAVPAGTRLRISANVAVQYRVGPAATVGSAVATDNDLPANTPEFITLLDNQDTIAFFSAIAGTAKVSVCAGATG